MIWQPEFTDKTLSRKPGAVHPVTEKCQKILTANLLIYHFTYVLIDEVT